MSVTEQRYEFASSLLRTRIVINTAAALVLLTCALENFEISVLYFSFLMCEEHIISTVSVMRIHILSRSTYTVGLEWLEGLCTIYKRQEFNNRHFSCYLKIVVDSLSLLLEPVPSLHFC